jgi:hypothetical protein
MTRRPWSQRRALSAGVVGPASMISGGSATRRV